MLVVTCLLFLSAMPLLAEDVTLQRAVDDGIDALDAGDYRTAMGLLRDAVGASDKDCAAPARDVKHIRAYLDLAKVMQSRGEEGWTREVVRRLAGCGWKLDVVKGLANMIRDQVASGDSWTLERGLMRTLPASRRGAITRAVEREEWLEAAKLLSTLDHHHPTQGRD